MSCKSVAYKFLLICLGALLFGFGWWLLGIWITLIIALSIALLWLCWQHHQFAGEVTRNQRDLRDLRTRLQAVEDATGGTILPEDQEHLKRKEIPSELPTFGPRTLLGVEFDQLTEAFDTDTDEWIMIQALKDAYDIRCTEWKKNDPAVNGPARRLEFNLTEDVPVLGRYKVESTVYYTKYVGDGSLSLVSEAYAKGPPNADKFSVRQFLHFKSEGGGIELKHWTKVKPRGSLFGIEGIVRSKSQEKSTAFMNELVQLLEALGTFEPDDPRLAELPVELNYGAIPTFKCMIELPFQKIREEMLKKDWAINDIVKKRQDARCVEETLKCTPWTDVGDRKVRRLQYQVELPPFPLYLRPFLRRPETGRLTSFYKWEEGNQKVTILHRMQCSDVPLLNRFILEEALRFTKEGNGTKFERWLTLTGGSGERSDALARRFLEGRVQQGCVEASESLRRYLLERTQTVAAP